MAIEESELSELKWEDCGATKSKLIQISKVKEEVTEWLWHPYIPKKKITMLEGDPGVGKSQITLAIAKAVSKGEPLPGQTSLPVGNVLLLCNEDAAEDTIRPRLRKMGADLERVFVFRGLLSLDSSVNIELQEMLVEVKPSVVIIDPVQAYLDGRVDMNRVNQVRGVLGSLAELAKNHDLALILVRHLAKGGGSKSIYQGLGSIDFTAAARSVLLIGCDPEEKIRRALVHIKANLSEFGVSQGYTVENGIFRWTGSSELTASIISGSDLKTDDGSLEIAKDFLLELLKDGPIESNIVTKEAKSVQIAYRTIERAKSALNIRSERLVRKWYYLLPDQTLSDSTPPTSGALDLADLKFDLFEGGL